MTEVLAQITGSVRQVAAEVGREVHEGDTLLVVEARKVEVPVASPVDGKVVEVRVALDDQVQEGDVVAIIQP